MSNRPNRTPSGRTTTRREFLAHAVAASVAVGAPSLVLGRARGAVAAEANSEIRIGVLGLGGMNIVGGVGGRGRQLIQALRNVSGARVVALCDLDRATLDHEVQQLKDRRQQVTAYSDPRRLFDDSSVDAVLVATPNHWHALATIWACQAGKDVYVEKPLCYNLWEGRQMVAAARKHGRMVQVGMQSRSSSVLQQAFEFLRSGQIGAIRGARALVYRAREPMIPLDGQPAIPATLDYDLWCGPSPKVPLARKQLHYDWHWFWATGNGEIGNNGIHTMDVCRWALGQNTTPPRAISIGGRWAFSDNGETANTQVAVLDYQPVPLVCEVRNLRKSKSPDSLGSFRGRDHGVLIDCEGGYFAGDANGGAVFDRKDQKIKEYTEPRGAEWPVATHLTNFVEAIRSRRSADLHAEVLDGYLSVSCCHMANVSHRLGKQAAPEAIAEAVRDNRDLADAFHRCCDHLRANGIDLAASPPVLGPWVTFDGKQHCFAGELADQANALSRRPPREPFVVPEVAEQA
jgi:predicted dehydrogenase